MVDKRQCWDQFSIFCEVCFEGGHHFAGAQSSFKIAAPTQKRIMRCSAEAKKRNAIRRSSTCARAERRPAVQPTEPLEYVPGIFARAAVGIAVHVFPRRACVGPGHQPKSLQ